MAASVPRKWRPSLGQVIFIVLATVMALPLVGLFFFRFLENQFVVQTESELIAETTVLAAVYAGDIAADPAALARLKPRPGLDAPGNLVAGRFHPIEPALDLTHDDILGRRAVGVLPAQPADPAFAAIGARVFDIARRTQDVTLAGFRILDPNGTVIGGPEEMGYSLAGVEEVAAALDGHYRSTLRLRISDAPPPPIYSISRGTGVRVFVAMPVIVDHAVAGVIYASRTPNNIFHGLYVERRKVSLAGAIVVGATFLIGLIFYRAISRPIHGLIAQTRHIGRDGDVRDEPLRHHGTREIALLSQSFLDMAGRLSERADYIRTFAAHVGHELKSPLTAIQGAAELLQEPMSEAQRRHFLANIIADTQRLTALLDRLRELARADNPPARGVATLPDIVSALRRTFPAIDIRLSGAIEQRFGMSLENAVIAFSQLADNAQRHNARVLRIEAAIESHRLVVIVADDGDGVSAANAARIFEPFFTTRRETGGTGMGLGIVRALLRAHDGDITWVPASAGTVFRIAMPRA